MISEQKPSQKNWRRAPRQDCWRAQIWMSGGTRTPPRRWRSIWLQKEQSSLQPSGQSLSPQSKAWKMLGTNQRTLRGTRFSGLMTVYNRLFSFLNFVSGEQSAAHPCPTLSQQWSRVDHSQNRVTQECVQTAKCTCDMRVCTLHWKCEPSYFMQPEVRMASPCSSSSMMAKHWPLVLRDTNVWSMKMGSFHHRFYRLASTHWQVLLVASSGQCPEQ